MIHPPQGLRLLFLGDLGWSARARMMLVALRDLGHTVTAVSTERLGEDGEGRRPSSMAARLLWRMGLPVDVARANEHLLRCAESEDFDVVWVVNARVLRTSTVQQLRLLQPGVPIAFYSEDDLSAWHNLSIHLVGCLRHFDVVFTAKSFNCHADELPRLGVRNLHYVDQSYDARRHRPVQVSPEDRERLGAPVGFVGTFEADRAEAMLHLARNGIVVRVWGGGWPLHWRIRHPNLRIEGRPLRGDEYPTALCATGINLGFLRKLNRDRHTSRSFEIPACGAFMLAERTDEHLRLFEEGVEAEYFADSGELLEKVRFYLDHPEARSAIAEAGFRRCQRSGYSYRDRLPSMLARSLAVASSAQPWFDGIERRRLSTALPRPLEGRLIGARPADEASVPVPPLRWSEVEPEGKR